MWPFGKKKAKAESASTVPERTKTLTLPDDHFAILHSCPVDEEEPASSPIILVINTPYVGFEHRDVFQWVLRLEVFVRKEEGGGLPSAAEAVVLDEMEIALFEAISPNNQKPNAVFVLRETDRDLRTIFFAVYDPEIANSALQLMLEEKRFNLPWKFSMKADEDWKAMDSYFKKFVEAVQGGYLH